MPIISPSSYPVPPFPLNNGHVQTILPCFFRKTSDIPYAREEFHTPDGDILLLDWSCIGSDKLVVISHGLCGHSRRHYVLSLVQAFNAAGWDCLAWNFRGTGGSPGIQFQFTTQNSTHELDWVVRHAIQKRHYKKAVLTGYSMGGNLSALYLAREPETLLDEVAGAVLFCATIDLVASAEKFHSPMGRRYAGYFVKDLVAMMRMKALQHPGRVDITGIDGIRTFEEFDDRFTAPYAGFRDSREYYEKASASRHLAKLNRPLLLVAPQNDPFLAGDCYPVQEARKNPLLFLEMPAAGGHCGFTTLGHRPWWPSTRAVEFAKSL